MGLRYLTIDAVIPAGTAISQIFDTGGQQVVGFQMPAVWTAADITFLASASESGAMHNVWNLVATELTMAAPLVNEFRSILNTELMLARRLQLQSGVFGTTVNQVAEATIVVVLLAE